MFKNKMSLRLRIFISMIFLVFTAILLILGSTYYQYRTESDQYNSYRQERKENQLKRQINYIVNKYNLSNNYSDWENYDNDFDEITKIHSVEYSIFTIQGAPLFYSYLPLDIISNNYSLDKDFANMLVAISGVPASKKLTMGCEIAAEIGTTIFRKSYLEKGTITDSYLAEAINAVIAYLDTVIAYLDTVIETKRVKKRK